MEISLLNKRPGCMKFVKPLKEFVNSQRKLLSTCGMMLLNSTRRICSTPLDLTTWKISSGILFFHMAGVDLIFSSRLFEIHFFHRNVDDAG